MPFYSRYRRRPYRYRRRYTRSRRYRRRRSYAASSASRIRIRVPVQQRFNFSIAANATQSNVATCHPWLQGGPNALPKGVASAIASTLYTTYCSLYDQVKCDAMSVRMSVIDPLGGGNNAIADALNIITAFDRFGTANNTISNKAQVGIPTVNQLKSNSSVVIRTAINNSIAKTSRVIAARDLQERTSFHDAAVGVPPGSLVTADLDFYSNLDRVPYFAPLYLAAVEVPTAPTVHFLRDLIGRFQFPHRQSPSFP